MKLKKPVAKEPPPAPCRIVKFDKDGRVVAEHTFVREQVPFEETSGYTANTVRNTLRIMAEQETGEEIFVCYASKSSAKALMAKALREHAGWRRVWTEPII